MEMNNKSLGKHLVVFIEGLMGTKRVVDLYREIFSLVISRGNCVIKTS